MSNYFKQLPNVYVRTSSYRQNSVDPYVLAKNIFRRIAIRENLEDIILGFSQYTVRNNDRPDQVALEYYDSMQYDWVVLLVNNIINIYDEWPMNEHELQQYIERKYQNGSGGIHHWVTQEITDMKGRVVLKGDIQVPEDFSYTKYDGTVVPKELLVRPISNYDFEYERNEYKRNIYLLRKDYLGQFVEEFGALVKYLPNEETDQDTLDKRSPNTVSEAFIPVKPTYYTNIGQTPSIAFATQQDFSSKVFESSEATINEGDTLSTGAVVARTTAASTSAIISTAGQTSIEQTNQYGTSVVADY
jgi:hypothetical protein